MTEHVARIGALFHQLKERGGIRPECFDLAGVLSVAIDQASEAAALASAPVATPAPSFTDAFPPL